MKKNIHVSCIIIMNDKKILILKRNSMGPRDNLWEFPGGKKEENENDENCAKRELYEELNIRIKNIRLYKKINYEYEDINIILTSFVSFIEKIPSLKLTVHSEYRWIKLNEIKKYEFPGANKLILDELNFDYQLFPEILDRININYDSIYGYDLPLIHSSISKIELYLKTNIFDYLIDAIEIKPSIYFDEPIDINDTFQKINPENKNYTLEERIYIEKKLISPSSIVWTVYQYLIKIIQNNKQSESIEKIKDAKLKIEKAIYSKTKINISKKNFKRFMGRNI